MVSLNAPFGARCFLTEKKVAPVMVYLSGLNAPYGAWRFLTGSGAGLAGASIHVLMHLMVLGAF